MAFACLLKKTEMVVFTYTKIAGGVLNTILGVVFSVTIATYTGPYNVIFAAIDVLVSTIVYSQTIEKCLPRFA
uniref:Uncharacterized protein n=1 Tax=Ditylenchus dipsaci TaxID=166011 RepID=A0A915EVG5_9BILA